MKLCHFNIFVCAFCAVGGIFILATGGSANLAIFNFVLAALNAALAYHKGTRNAKTD